MASEQSSPPTEVSVRELVMDLAVTGGYDGPQPNQDELLASIGIDSLLTIELVVRLEDHFGIEVPDELLTPTSFATLGSVAALVKHLQ